MSRMNGRSGILRFPDETGGGTATMNPPPHPPTTPPTQPKTAKDGADGPVQTSPMKAGPCRMVILFSTQLAPEGTPAVVMTSPKFHSITTVDGLVVQQAGQHVDVNGMFHGGVHAKALARVRASSTGNTFVDVPVYDALTPEERIQVAQRAGHNLGMWCEWPPKK